MIWYVDQWEPGERLGCQLTKPQLLGQACPGTSVFSHLDTQAQKLLCRSLSGSQDQQGAEGLGAGPTCTTMTGAGGRGNGKHFVFKGN